MNRRPYQSRKCHIYLLLLSLPFHVANVTNYPVWTADHSCKTLFQNKYDTKLLSIIFNYTNKLFAFIKVFLMAEIARTYNRWKFTNFCKAFVSCVEQFTVFNFDQWYPWITKQNQLLYRFTLKGAFPLFGQNFVFDVSTFQSKRTVYPENLSLLIQLVPKRLQKSKWKMTHFSAFWPKNASFSILFLQILKN